MDIIDEAYKQIKHRRCAECRKKAVGFRVTNKTPTFYCLEHLNQTFEEKPHDIPTDEGKNG